MRISCYVRPFYPLLGGIETISNIVSKCLSDEGNDVLVLTTTELGNCSEVDDKRCVIRAPRMIALFKSFRDSDIILFFGLSLRALPIAVLSGRPIVISHHGVYESSGGILSNVARRFRIAITRFFTNVYVSDFVRREIDSKGVVINNAYEDSIFRIDLEVDKKFQYCFCGRLVDEKGVLVLLEAFYEVSMVDTDASLLVIGDGPERSNIELKVLEMGILGRVTFAGACSANLVASMMTKCNVVVVPSIYREPFGIVALEALASGCKLIVSDRGGLPEASGGFALVVEPTVAELSNAMKSINDIAIYNPDAPSIERYLKARRSRVVGMRYLRVLRHVIGKRN